LLRTGKISNFEDGGFWIDKIKSHAIIEYSSPEDADETVMALDGTKWPSTNPKMLTATFSTKKVLVKANTDNDVPLRSNLNKDNYRRVSSKDESEDLFRKRKHSETQSEAAGGLYYEESAQGKRIRNSSEKEAGTEEKSDSPKPKKHLDDLFRKTKALPCIYWMPKQLKDSKS
jgi:apoptotic chromatin condensation inducer in the nucleus